MKHWCSYCGSKLHNVNLCPGTSAGQSARLHLRCTYCGGRDHSIEACMKTFRGSLFNTNHYYRG